MRTVKSRARLILPCLLLALEKGTLPLLDTTGKELTWNHIGEMAPVFRRAGPNIHHRHGRAGTDSLCTGKLALPSSWGWSDQIKYNEGLGLAQPHFYPTKGLQNMWRDCRTEWYLQSFHDSGLVRMVYQTPKVIKWINALLQWKFVWSCYTFLLFFWGGELTLQDWRSAMEGLGNEQNWSVWCKTPKNKSEFRLKNKQQKEKQSKVHCFWCVRVIKRKVCKECQSL